MSAAAQTYQPAAPSFVISLERLRGALLWLTGLSGAFVFVEPSPYEVASLLTMIVFVMTGLTLRPALLPLILMLVLYDLGFGLSVLQVADQQKTVIWVLISIYMTVTTIFFASMLNANTQQRLDLLCRGYIAAATVASLVAILAYFNAFGSLSEQFLRYSRARGTFNDPNVLGAFLIFPALLVLQRVISDRSASAVRGAGLLLLFTTALLLSFSRAAWGQLAGTAVLLIALTFITSRSQRERTRIALIATAGLVLVALFLMALLSIDRIAELFEQRAALEQSYDLGHLGRFGRYTLGAVLALDDPFGIGPLQFHNFFPEDPHNTYLNTFMSGGWLSGCVYPAIVLSSLVMGVRFVFVETPWRKVYLAVFSAFVGVTFESAIIDSDHWRHYFLLLGVLWGLMIASRPYLVRARVSHTGTAHLAQ
jgi:O-antigen ligase